MASTFSLSAPFPNPARGSARCDLELGASAQVEVSVFDAAGRRVRLLARGNHAMGRHVLAWDGRDERGSRVRAGVYFVRATDGPATRTRRLVLTD
jgi:flagellar hook assembly protein FlgD